MKKIYFLIILATLACSTGFAQIMQASLGTGSSPTRFKVYLKSSMTETPATLSTLQFNFGFSNTFTKPTMTVVSTTLSGVTWGVTEADEGGYNNFQVTTNAGFITVNTTANTEFEVMEVEFSNVPAGASAALVSLPDGGTTGNSMFYCTSSTVNSDGSNLYFARTGVTVNNNFTYLDFVTPGTTTSTATVSNGPLSSITDQFRTVQSGNWNNVSTWESSPDGITWMPATLTPDDNSGTIQVRNGHTVTVTAPLTIDETFVDPQGSIVTTSALTVQNQGLTFQSDANFTGMLGNSSGTVTGDVTVERFMPAKRAWRLMNSPVNSTETINAAWQESFGNTAGHGTQITGGSAANGFDQSPSNTSSIKSYDAGSGTLVPMAATNVAISAQPGYFVFVRGDRTINLSQGTAAVATNTTLTVTGSANTGLQVMPVGSSGFTLIGNPFISPIDFSTITKTSVPDRFYVWDPKRAGVGAYVLFDGADSYVPLTIGGSYNAANTLIQTGQSFFVQTAGAGASLGINESNKSVTQKNVFRTSNTDQKLQVNLHLYNDDNTTILADATATKYNDQYSASVTAEDAGKPDNIDENIAVVRDNKLLTIERRPFSGNNETIALKMYNMKPRNYQFEIIAANFSDPLLSAYLEDAYLGTSTPVSLASPALIRFKVTADAASANPYRFKIVFKTAGTLPVSITKVKAYKKNSGIQVDWTMDNEIAANVDHYEVEKSAKGTEFTKMADAKALKLSANADYNRFDAAPLKGYNYYRIKVVDASGRTAYSQVVNVKMDNIKNSIALYPNPVKKEFYFTMTNAADYNGKIRLTLVNSLGQSVDAREISAVQAAGYYYNLPKAGLSSGTYLLNVYCGEKFIESKQVIVQP